jgi:hypothetical protein
MTILRKFAAARTKGFNKEHRDDYYNDFEYSPTQQPDLSVVEALIAKALPGQKFSMSQSFDQ